MTKPSRRTDIRMTDPATLPTKHGMWLARAFINPAQPEKEHLALVFGKVAGAAKVLVRVQSECVTGEVFGSQKCDCGPQLELAMKKIRSAGNGVILYLRQEGRGIGLFDKIRAYALQDGGLDTVEANRKLGLPDDLRTYGEAAGALRALKVKSVRVLTNDTRKSVELEREGVKIAGRVPLQIKPNVHNRGYLKAKRDKLGHDV